MRRGAELQAFVTHVLGACAISLAVLSVPAWAQDAVGAAELVSATATVEKIDLDKRMVTLKDAAGDSFTVHVGAQVENLPEVAVGDSVTVEYYESMVADVAKPTEGSGPGVVEVAEVGEAFPGGLPAGEEAVVMTATSEVVGVSPPEHKLLFIAPDGGLRTVMVTSPEDQPLLSELKVGDLVQVTFAEAEAVAVTPAQ